MAEPAGRRAHGLRGGGGRGDSRGGSHPGRRGPDPGPRRTAAERGGRGSHSGKKMPNGYRTGPSEGRLVIIPSHWSCGHGGWELLRPAGPGRRGPRGVDRLCRQLQQPLAAADRFQPVQPMRSGRRQLRSTRGTGTRRGLTCPSRQPQPGWADGTGSLRSTPTAVQSLQVETRAFVNRLRSDRPHKSSSPTKPETEVREPPDAQVASVQGRGTRRLGSSPRGAGYGEHRTSTGQGAGTWRMREACTRAWPW